MLEGSASDADRSVLERLLGQDLRELTSETDSIARAYAEQNDLSANEFRALMFVVIAEESAIRMTAGDLRNHMGLSGAAITYLVERTTASGHLRRESDPGDRRKVILRPDQRGLDIASTFYETLYQHGRSALVDAPDEDLHAAHRTFTAIVNALRAFRAEVSGEASSD